MGGQKDEEKMYSLQVDIIGKRAEIISNFLLVLKSPKYLFFYLKKLL